MKFRFHKSARRYLKTCRYLQQFLHNRLLDSEWLESDTRIELIKRVRDVIICDGAIDELWEIVCYICEKMVDHNIDDNTFHTFLTNALLIREWGDC